MKFKFSLMVEREDGAHVEPVTLWDFQPMTDEQVAAVIEAEKTNWATISPLDYSDRVPEQEDPMSTTKEQVAAALGIVVAVGEVIRDLNDAPQGRLLGGVPSGELYAGLNGKLNIHEYNSVIEALKRARLVTESNAHLLTWIGPKKDEEGQ